MFSSYSSIIKLLLAFYICMSELDPTHIGDAIHD